jgi:outer membrane protein TolC
MSKLLVFLLCALSALSGFSQPTISNPFLDESLKQALEKNGLIKEQNALIQQQQASYNLATRQFGPEISLGTSYTLAAGGRSISFPLGDLLNPVSNALNDLTSSNDFPQYQNQNILFLPNNFYDLRTRIVQPILRPEIKANRLIKQEQIGLQQLQKEIISRTIIRDVKKAYYQYIQSGESIAILQQGLVQLAEGERVTQSLINNGVALPSAILRIQAEKSKLLTQLFAAENQRTDARAYFNYLTGRSSQDSIIAVPVSILPIPDTYTTAVRTEETASLDKGIAIQKLAIDLENKFQVDIGTQNFNFQWGGYLLGGLQLDIPLYDNKKSKYKTEELRAGMQANEEKKDWAIKSLDLQLQQAKRQLKTAIDQYHSYTPIADMSRRYFWEIQRKYKEGQATPAELVDAQTQITFALLQQNIALYQAWIQAVEIENLTSKQ